MRKVSVFLAGLFIIIFPSLTRADVLNLGNLSQGYSTIQNPFIYLGQKTALTNYEVGTCKNHENGYWMQLADGTWAEPGSALNLCQTDGTASSWLNSYQLNPWLRSGIGLNNVSQNYVQQSGYSTNYGTALNNYGRFTSYQDWYNYCVLAESFAPRPECTSSQYNYSTMPWNLTYGANLFVRTKIGDTGTLTIATSASSKDLGGIIGGVLLYNLIGNLFK